VSTTNPEAVSIYVSGDVPDDDIDELARVLDEAGLDAVVGPYPDRMGLVADLPGLLIEAPLDVAAAFVVTLAGQHAWRLLTRIARRRRDPARPTGGTDPAPVAIQDTDRRIRLDLTLDDLADPQVREQLASLRPLAETSTELVLRWDASGGWRIQPPP
jgi:hypothetical protein